MCVKARSELGLQRASGLIYIENMYNVAII